jgi:hypothetical protein
LTPNATTAHLTITIPRPLYEAIVTLVGPYEGKGTGKRSAFVAGLIAAGLDARIPNWRAIAAREGIDIDTPTTEAA